MLYTGTGQYGFCICNFIWQVVDQNVPWKLARGRMGGMSHTHSSFLILFNQYFYFVFYIFVDYCLFQNLNDRLSSTFIDTLLAMTIFRENFNAAFVALFVLLLSSKIFHWTIQDRVDYVCTLREE